MEEIIVRCCCKKDAQAVLPFWSFCFETECKEGPWRLWKWEHLSLKPPKHYWVFRWDSSCAQCGKILKKKLAEISGRRRSILGVCWCCECERGEGGAAVKRSLAGSPISSIWNRQPTQGNFYRQLQRKRGGMQAAGGDALKMRMSKKKDISPKTDRLWLHRRGSRPTMRCLKQTNFML